MMNGHTAKQTKISARVCLAITVLLFTYASNTLACNPELDDCVPIGQFEFQLGLGLGVRTNPISNSDDIPLVLIPRISYYGKHFFIDNLDIGYSAYESESSQLNLLITPGYDSVYFHRSDPRNFFIEVTTSVPVSDVLTNNPGQEASGDRSFEIHQDQLKDRDLAVLAGFEYLWFGRRNEFKLMVLGDISDTHDGTEIRAAYRHLFRIGTHQVGIAAGINHKNEKLLDYYYGLDADEIPGGLLTYRVKDDYTALIGFDWEKPSMSRWRWLGKLNYEVIGENIRNSPLVKDDAVITFFIGKTYAF